jgi:hypothetical protein
LFRKIIDSLSFSDFKLGVSHDLWILNKVKRSRWAYNEVFVVF